MALQLLKRTKAQPAGKSTVTIGKENLRFSKTAREAHELDGFSYAQLFSDDETPGKFVVKLLKEKAQDSAKLHQGVVDAKPWIKDANLPHGTYDLVAGAEGDTLEFTVPTAEKDAAA